MPRQPRYFLPGLPQHVVQRGVNRQPVFFKAQDRSLYMNVLVESANQYEVDVHAYVLMTNHVHLLVTPRRERSIPLLIQAIGRGYVQKLNRISDRTGTLWEGRYKASLVQSDRYLLACSRYIEMNPVRAGMVDDPGRYAYSSYRRNALGEFDPVVTAHQTYLALGRSAEKRLAAYRALFGSTDDTNLTTRIRTTTNACRVLGDSSFKDKVESILGKSVRPGRCGRPRRRSAD